MYQMLNFSPFDLALYVPSHLDFAELHEVRNWKLRGAAVNFYKFSFFLGNAYNIKNARKEEAMIFFVQIKG